MNPRTQNILTAAIESFIKTSSPVSSGFLFDEFNFGIKPAMIRHELEELTDMGFLEQPYHSAGRIPSDQGYQFLVDQILLEDNEPPLNSQIEHLFWKSQWPEFLEVFSRSLSLLGAIELKREHRLYKAGLEKLIRNFEWENQEELSSIIRDFEGLDNRIDNLKKEVFPSDEIRVFIGSESPITESPELSIVAEKCFCDGKEIFLMAIGPKRMNYKKVVGTFRGLKKNRRKCPTKIKFN